MIALATGDVTARTEDDRVVASIKSGGDMIEVALTFHQACLLANKLLREAIVTLDHSRLSASVIPFPAHVRRPRRRKPGGGA